MNLEGAYESIGRQVKKMVKEAGAMPALTSLDVHKDEHGVHAILEFQDSNLISATFVDDASYSLERRELLEVSFAIAAAIAAGIAEAA